MERKVKQIIFYSDGDSRNYPQKVSNNTIELSKSINSITGITSGCIERVGIQLYTPESGKLLLASLSGHVGVKELRPYEIYEACYKNLNILYDFYFDYNFIKKINNNKNDYIIIDIIYRL